MLPLSVRIKDVIMLVIALLGLVSVSEAHMEMKDPAPLRSSLNKFTANQDYDMKSPLSSKGSNFPCKGSLGLLGTPQGQSVAAWTAGQSKSMAIVGGAAHGGGSCQASLSYDGGKSFTVIHSYIGGCPVVGESTYQFAVPSDAPSGENVLFSWSWFNNVGNREMYHNCAVVTIRGGGAGVDIDVGTVSGIGNGTGTGIGNGKDASNGTDVDTSKDIGKDTGKDTGGDTTEAQEEEFACAPDQAPGNSRRDSIPFSSRPKMFVANVNNGCGTIEGSDVEFPNPGPDVDRKSKKTSKPVGKCDS